jgi:Zn-dependent protease with chaperone function
MTLILVFLTGTAPWSIPLLLLALGVASHGPRKALLGETWSLPRYLEWRTRVLVGTLGFWIVLALTPAVVSVTPPPVRWVVALLLLSAMLAWHHFYARILLVVLKATPLQRADLEPFFTPVFQRTTAIIPALWRAGAEGGVFANALALPAIAQGRVLFFDTLLERLHPNEVAAILAHELAHLEHFHVRLLRKMYLVTSVAIVLVVCGSVTLAAAAPASTWIASSFCPVVVFTGLALRARRMQAEETKSDRRAVALCGDPDALISGLTRLHEIHHMPRRLSPDVEQHATHPSLARRIRAIREGATERRADALLSPAVLRSSEPGRLAILEPERFTLVWAAADAPHLLDDPIGAAKRIEARAYDQLSELRLATAADGRAVLTARSIDGGRWTVPLQAGEAARAQSALNVVDQLLAPPTSTRQDVSHRAVALITVVLTALLKTLAPIVVTALVAFARPTRRICLALAAALLTTAFITGGDSPLDAVRVLVLALLAAAAVWQSYQLKAKDVADPTIGRGAVHIEAAVLAIPVLLAVAWIGATSRDLFGLHTTMRDAAWPAASLMALAVYLGMSTPQVLRRAGVFAGALTGVALFAASTTFLTRMVTDPLVADAPELVEQSSDLTTVAETSVEGEFTQVRLAADARHFLLSQEPDHEADGHPRQHVIGAFDGWSRELKAVDAALAGSDRVLLLDRNNGDTQLRAEKFRSTAAPAWALKVRDIEANSMRAGTDGRWHVMNRHRNAFTRVDGRVGSTVTSRTSWDVQAAPTEYVSLHGVSTGNVAVGVAVAYADSMLPWWLSGWNWREKTTLLRVDGRETQRVATSSLNLSCADPAIDASAYLCVAFDGRWSRFWRYNVERGILDPIGRARGRFFIDSQDTHTTVGAMRAGAVVGIDVAAGRITTFDLGGNTGVVDYDFTDEFLVVSSLEGNRTVVRLYRLADPSAPRSSFASHR